MCINLLSGWKISQVHFIRKISKTIKWNNFFQKIEHYELSILVAMTMVSYHFFFILVFGQKVMFPEQSTLINIHCPKVDIRDSLVSEGIGRPGENFYF